VLGTPRGRSVFPPPVRPAVHCGSYGTAKATQEELTDGSLGTQSWAICDKIAEMDCFLSLNDDARMPPGDPNVIREAHPEVCFWALNGEEAMTHSKTGEPLMAFWERVAVLERIDGDILGDIRDAGSAVNTSASNDDLLDAFALAVTASSLTGTARTLPESPEDDDRELPMEMVYATG
jgi:predicted RNase H-like nuclease